MKCRLALPAWNLCANVLPSWIFMRTDYWQSPVSALQSSSQTARVRGVTLLQKSP
jgi:hypothetical protein